MNPGEDRTALPNNGSKWENPNDSEQYMEELTMEKILEILSGIDSTVNFAGETEIIDNEYLDSMQLMDLISELEDAFDITIEMEDIVPENFNSVSAMWEMVQRLQ